MAMQTFTPIEYLKIDVAGNFGLDKKSWNERIAWFDAHEHELEDLVNQAEEPALFFAGMRAYQAAKRGEAIGYPISLDATASGPQIMAALVNCETTAKLCNVVDTGQREDLYTNLSDSMQVRVNAIGESLSIERSDAKQAIMTSFYGSKAQPKRIFGEGPVLDTYYQTMEEEAPGAWQLNMEILQMWNPTASIYEWTLPDNFHVKCKVEDTVFHSLKFDGFDYTYRTKENRPTDEGRSLGANLIHSIDGMVVREILRRCTFDPAKVLNAYELCTQTHTHQADKRSGPNLKSPNTRSMKILMEHYEITGFLSARVLDYLDEDTIHIVPRNAVLALLKSMPEKPFPVLSVHDCFRVHPNYGNDLRRQYNQVLYEIAVSELLSDLISQIQGTRIKAAKLDDMAGHILQANYALS